MKLARLIPRDFHTAQQFVVFRRQPSTVKESIVERCNTAEEHPRRDVVSDIASVRE